MAGEGTASQLPAASQGQQSPAQSFAQFAASPQGAQAQSFDEFAAGQGSEQAPKSMTGKALDAAGRVLDYPGGFVRAGLAEAVGAATGNGSIVTEDDLKNAAVGKGPNSAEYLRRMGVSEGGSLTLPGLGRVTLRGAEGLALDIATDPLTLVAKTMKQIPYLKDLIEAPGKASEALGEAVYKSAVTAKDPAKAAEAGRALIENGGAPIAGNAGLQQKIADTASIMGKMRGALYDEFNQLGGKIDGSAKDLYKNAEGVLSTLRQNPTLAPVADKLEGMLNQYKGQGFVPVEQMSQWKTQLYDSVGAAFDGKPIPNPAKAFKAALAIDMKNAIVDSGNAVKKGLGDAINDINSKWGGLLEAKPNTGAGGGSLGKSIDALAVISAGIPGYVKKKALEMATGPYGKTLIGNALMHAGKDAHMNSLTLANAAQRNGGGQESVPETEQ